MLNPDVQGEADLKKNIIFLKFYLLEGEIYTFKQRGIFQHYPSVSWGLGEILR